MDTSGQWRPFHELMPLIAPSVWALGLTLPTMCVKRVSGQVLRWCLQSPADLNRAPRTSPCLLRQRYGSACSKSKGDVYGEALCHAGALLDYEVEVGMVLLADWHPSDSHSPRWGFVLVNDATARSVQMAGLGRVTRCATGLPPRAFRAFCLRPSRSGAQMPTTCRHGPKRP